MIPTNSHKVQVKDSIVDFFKTKEDDINIYYFDTSECQPQGPIVNAVVGLKLIDGTKDEMTTLNHSIPKGLFGEIEQNFTYEVKEIENNLYKIVFKYEQDSSSKTDYDDNQCSG